MKFDALKDISAVVQAPPLVVDLDGTLVKSDLLIESAFAALGNNPASLFGMLGAYLRGKPALKSWIAEGTDI
ncbi:MAG: hypothetical protein B7Z26_01840, partial [Asticcacaulis sp. 32-58-5]